MSSALKHDAEQAASLLRSLPKDVKKRITEIIVKLSETVREKEELQQKFVDEKAHLETALREKDSVLAKVQREHLQQQELARKEHESLTGHLSDQIRRLESIIREKDAIITQGGEERSRLKASIADMQLQCDAVRGETAGLKSAQEQAASTKQKLREALRLVQTYQFRIEEMLTETEHMMDEKAAMADELQSTRAHLHAVQAEYAKLQARVGELEASIRAPTVVSNRSMTESPRTISTSSSLSMTLIEDDGDDEEDLLQLMEALDRDAELERRLAESPLKRSTHRTEEHRRNNGLNHSSLSSRNLKDDVEFVLQMLNDSV
jgi:predicted  nucleic acid-binding Zn-ribbon protein